MQKIEIRLPIRTVSEANNFEHWTRKHKRHAFQRKQVSLAFLNFRHSVIPLPCHVTITRIAPRPLDEEDNLRMAVKYIKDYIADKLVPGKRIGFADGDKRITWHYAQQKGTKPREYAVKIEIDCNI